MGRNLNPLNGEERILDFAVSTVQIIIAIITCCLKERQSIKRFVRIVAVNMKPTGRNNGFVALTVSNKIGVMVLIRQ